MASGLRPSGDHPHRTVCSGAGSGPGADRGEIGAIAPRCACRLERGHFVWAWGLHAVREAADGKLRKLPGGGGTTCIASRRGCYRSFRWGVRISSILLTIISLRSCAPRLRSTRPRTPSPPAPAAGATLQCRLAVSIEGLSNGTVLSGLAGRAVRRGVTVGSPAQKLAPALRHSRAPPVAAGPHVAQVSLAELHPNETCKAELL